ncbi:MAG: hypothetical protein QNJ60_09835 [Xenococcaceae cyanobacterium MO_188.B19]|nr:hypothetical protein [Xenococcaceae cyanobacterium MO_188.B19]
MNNTSKKVDFDTELKTTKFPDFKVLVLGFKEISLEVQKLNARKNSPYGIYGFYQLLKKVTKPLYQIFNSKSNSKKSISNLKQSINYLNILIRETLAEGILAQFKKQLEKLQELMISLFPEGEVFQLSLFDIESYTDNKQRSAFQSFLDWLRDVKVFGLGKMSSVEAKTVKSEQLSIKFV